MEEYLVVLQLLSGACDIIGIWEGGWDESLCFVTLCCDLVKLCLPPCSMLQMHKKGFCSPVNQKLPVLHELLPAMRFPVNITEKGLCTPTLGVTCCC